MMPQRNPETLHIKETIMFAARLSKINSPNKKNGTKNMAVNLKILEA